MLCNINCAFLLFTQHLLYEKDKMIAYQNKVFLVLDKSFEILLSLSHRYLEQHNTTNAADDFLNPL